MYAVRWRYMIPPGVFLRATRGSYVFHDSLLPEYRGFAPTVWAIANGEDHTGVTLFERSERFDEGDVVDQSRLEIGEADPIGVVMERVTATYLALLERNFGGLVEGTAPRRPQDHARATYCCKRLPEDAEIDWRRPAREVANLVRAYAHPYPGAFTWVDGRKLTVWEAAVVAGAPRYVGRVPGRVVETVAGGACTVLTGDGLVALREVQVAGEPARPAGDVVRKFAATLGRKKEETA
jgi:methionyl-tRNA formyltransferase